MNKLVLLLASTALGAAPAFAAEQTVPTGGLAPGSDHVHELSSGDIIVTARFVRQLDVLAGTSALTGTALLRDLQPQIGETLTRLPGVSATSFGPGASRPVLRGFQGERVRVMIDGLGSIDASSTSADHAVTIDPITTDRIEVLHGPAVLLFGSQAIGGAVNAFDRRIPRALPDGHFHLDAVGAYGSAANERSLGSGVDFQIGNSPVVIHLDGSWRRTGDLRVGGFVLSPELRAEQLHIAEEEEEEGHLEEAAEARALAGLRGRLPNSFTRQKTAGAGIALIQERGNLGFSVSYFGSRYGVPERPGGGHGHHDDDDHDHDHDHDDDHGHHHEGPVSIDMKQIRADLRGELEIGGGFIDNLRLRLAGADYEHTEFEGDEIGTVFRGKGMEGRLELVQADRNGWRGVSGTQYFARDFSAVGAEAFVPPYSNSQFGLFTLQELNFGLFEIEGAARYEHTRVSSRAADFARGFDAFSVAVGGSYEFSPFVRAGLNLSRAERAPAAEELLSDGPHIATQAYEIGDPDLRLERSLGAELFLRAQTPRHRLTASLFANRFDNYIFQAATGDEEDGLPVFQYMQQGANHWGFEIGGQSHVWRTGNTRFLVDGVADYVRVSLRGGGGAVPRIPPLRIRGGIAAQQDRWELRGEVERVFAQNRVAEFENPTAGFTMVNAALTITPWGRDNPNALILSANNIFDVEARRHASFTKDFVPLGGRDLRVSARLSF